MRGDSRPALHESRRRVVMADTDAAGVIYFGCVFRWHETEMMEWLESAGHPIRGILREGFAFPCVHSEADYTYPLRVDDVLDVQLNPGRVGRTSFELISDAWLGERRAVQVRAAYVWAEISASPEGGFRKTALPAWLRITLEANGGSD